MASIFDAYETVIGLECHVQLLTESKLFSPAPNRFGDPANENVDLVDAGLPGVLPVVNERAIELAVRLGLALGCEVHETSIFARKHYFYADLPKGYQISQFERPICEGGGVPIDVGGDRRTVELTRIHIEEDAGKLVHTSAGGGASLVDLNRAGTPLLEVVSEPDLRSPEEAMAYVRSLRQIVVALGVGDGNMQEGSLRADANVSVRKKGTAELGQRTETKNLNSIRFLGQAIEAEVRRQVVELEAGRPIVQQTRLWDPDKRESRVMRTKEDADDYRYMPDPDLPPLIVAPELVESVQANLPELPQARAARYVEEGVPADAAQVLVDEATTWAYFEQARTAAQASAAQDQSAPDDAALTKTVANWVVNEALATSDDLGDAKVTAESLGKLVTLVLGGSISGKIAKDVFAELLSGDEPDPAKIVEAKGWKVERDQGRLEAFVQEAIDQNPKQLEQYRAGKTKLLGFFVGQVMKKSRGQADPAEVNRLLKSKLDG